MISRLTANMSIHQLAIRPDHEQPSELPGVTLNARLARTCTKSAQRIQRKPRGEQFNPASSKAGRAICAKIRIDQNWTIEVEILSEGRRKIFGSVPDDDDLCSTGAYFVHSVAQLRDLLSAKQSTKVANEYEYDRTFSPK
jgi:hypothetical protein